MERQKPFFHARKPDAPQDLNVSIDEQKNGCHVSAWSVHPSLVFRQSTRLSIFIFITTTLSMLPFPSSTLLSFREEKVFLLKTRPYFLFNDRKIKIRYVDRLFSKTSIDDPNVLQYEQNVGRMKKKLYCLNPTTDRYYAYDAIISCPIDFSVACNFP